jgi:hypothetical protein
MYHHQLRRLAFLAIAAGLAMAREGPAEIVTVDFQGWGLNNSVTLDFPEQCCDFSSAEASIDDVTYDFIVETIAWRDIPANANHDVDQYVMRAISFLSQQIPLSEFTSDRFPPHFESGGHLPNIHRWLANEEQGFTDPATEEWIPFPHLRFYLEPFYLGDLDEIFFTTPMPWGYGVPREEEPLGLGDNLLANSGFDVPRNTVGLPDKFRAWGGDWTGIVEYPQFFVEPGILPIDEGMLQFGSTSPSQSPTDPGVGSTSDILQYVDLAPLADYDGELTALLTASFNRVAGDEQTDTEFALVLAAHQGTPENSPGQATSMAHEISYIITDGNIETWEQQSVELSIPAGADFLQVTLAAIENVFDDSGYLAEFDGHFADAASLIVYIRGDTDIDGSITVGDIDTLASLIRAGDYDRLMDLDRDGSLTQLDSHILINDLLASTHGDANLDGQFNSSDLIDVLASGTYETDVDSTWSTGDWDGDGRTTSGDLVTALATGSYEAGELAAIASVPEPSGILLMLAGLAAVSLSSFYWRRPS